MQPFKHVVDIIHFCSSWSKLKGTVSVISSDPQCKDDNARFTTVPLKPFTDQKWQFLHCGLYYKQEMQVTISQRNRKWSLMQFKATKTLISNSYLISLKGYCCKSGIAIFAAGGLLENTLTVSLTNLLIHTRKQCVVQQGEPNLRCANFSGESNNLINWQIHFAT